MAGVRVSWSGTLKDLRVGILIIALGRWLDDVDGVVSWSVAVLPPPKVVLLTQITIVVAPIIVAVIAASVIAPVVGVAILLVGSRSSTNVFLDLLVGLVSICPLLYHREQVLD
jgi:hypothetical protein